MNQSVGFETPSIRLIDVRFSHLPLRNLSVTSNLAILLVRADGDPNVPLKFVAHVMSYHHQAGEHPILAKCPSTCRYAAYALIQRY